MAVWALRSQTTTALAEEPGSPAYAEDEPGAIGDPAAMTPVTAAPATTGRRTAVRHAANGLNMSAGYYADNVLYSA